jgi:hypothetical protein
LDDRKEAFTTLLEIDLLTQCRGEVLDRFLPFSLVKTSLNVLLNIHAPRSGSPAPEVE